MKIQRLIPALAVVAFAAACSDTSSPPTSPAPRSTAAFARQTTSALSAIPITGTQTVGTVTSTFNGLLNITNIALNSAGQLVASGTLTDLAGNVITTLTDIPLNLLGSGAGAACQILQLNVGAIDLNLLGLTLHLDAIHLDLAAQPGPGNLLGNLLCAVAHLLDGGNLGALGALLNQVNAILGGLGL